MIDPQPENGDIAAELREMSILLERQQANPFRVRKSDRSRKCPMGVSSLSFLPDPAISTTAGRFF